MTEEGTSSSNSRRREAQSLAEELLGDIELGRIKATDVARKASRLARLLDDSNAIAWLSYETGGYPDPLDAVSAAAVQWSRREGDKAPDGSQLYWTGTLGEIEQEVEGALAQIAAAAGSGTSSSEWAVTVEQNKATTLSTLRSYASKQRGLLDRIIGAIHAYVAAQYQELRFGASVESAFEVVRSEVDQAIGELVPGGLAMIAAAFENAGSDNPEHWSNAASTCRRLLKSAADALRPPGESIVTADGKEVQMGEGNYINRLVAWVNEQATSETAARMIATDLEFLGRRLDAADQAGQKGAHASVTRYDASRFITGTYLVLGDLLRLRAGSSV